MFVRNDLQEEHYSGLRSEIFRHILLFSSGPRIVLTRLCIAVSQPGLLNNGIIIIINQYRDRKSRYVARYSLVVMCCQFFVLCKTLFFSL